jgi:hypothetical protein
MGMAHFLSIESLFVTATDIIGRGRAGPLDPVPLVILFVGKDADIRGCTAQNGRFVVASHNVVLAVPATILCHYSIYSISSFFAITSPWASQERFDFFIFSF